MQESRISPSFVQFDGRPLGGANFQHSQSRNLATPQSRNLARNRTITQPCNATIMQPCNATITQPCKNQNCNVVVDLLDLEKQN
jgi:hypothetical protein